MNRNQRRPAPNPGPPIYLLLGIAAALSGLLQFPIAAHASPQALRRYYADLPRIAQGEGEGDESEVASTDIDKYVAVYKAMQRDRSLTVEQAATGQGMTLRGFRDLENRIERDESAREHARDALRAAVSPEASPSPLRQPGATPSRQPHP